ncbi:hypothetical protein CXG81DRAFT_23809 [Caulochytrium protostelioides]|uniref:Cytochrome c oxidase assembly factor 5 n=1 Tax=Caulochytrium protostelioides TaxID=1555241 RepID=A0A4P9XDK1_9FUNG|nr:hypothetical protein CXG81DRAFT_23809 [Caulochytrium protostelioides]|eukprot:RKP03548.1 hypothetical protein CXG81DRAFT_23809 [Caulochytrium protostelioides]
MPSCDAFYRDLITCLAASDCVVKEKHAPQDCLDPRAHPHSVDADCRRAQRAWLECKHSLFNPRRRFRNYGGGGAEHDDDDDDGSASRSPGVLDREIDRIDVYHP